MAVKFVFVLTVFLLKNYINAQEEEDDLMAIIKSTFKIGPDKDPLDFLVPTSAPVIDSEIKSSGQSCGLGKQCVREYLCSNGNVKKFGDVKLFNLRLGEDAENECPFLYKCCSVEDTVSEPIIRPTKIASGCGRRNTDGVGFAIEGAMHNEAEFGEFPWMLAILRGRNNKDDRREIYQCGGSLIHPQVALTTAHCVYGHEPSAFVVRAGEWETNSKAEPFPDVNLNVQEIVIHPNYNIDNLHNDIALLFLVSPFELAAHINTVCLPPAGFMFDFEKCFATGWGKDKFENGKYQNILKKIDLPVVPSFVCQDNLRKTRLGMFFELDKSFLCAGGESGKDTCEGDGGSPLSCPIKNSDDRFYQAGIVAWGIGCGKENVPGVYVNVSNFREWIDQELAVKHLAVGNTKDEFNVRSG
ncbi:phenoloxidase-activating factor 2-like [Episyrphus balteatus]|uniref:phenoloxidase-activating factor 2-like n=1 Tax=Episyrphus balteatus TaxID=286459 RepID=UPI0024869042|nr:phenoloxidase-activating factor 2-like [Episyrphus balteatus]